MTTRALSGGGTPWSSVFLPGRGLGGARCLFCVCGYEHFMPLLVLESYLCSTES